jgi:predicted Zn-dependent protease
MFSQGSCFAMPAVSNDYAVALLRVNKVDRAIAECLVGLKNDPESPFLHKNLASAYARQGKFKQALVHAREATRLDPAVRQNARMMMLYSCASAE